jgi:hypothetical protein
MVGHVAAVHLARLRRARSDGGIGDAERGSRERRRSDNKLQPDPSAADDDHRHYHNAYNPHDDDHPDSHVDYANPDIEHANTHHADAGGRHLAVERKQ